MIIGHDPNYLFIQVPHTACTGVGLELCELYGGSPCLKKHGTLEEFLASPEGRNGRYFTFGTLRNPLDVAVTLYLKLKTNHKEQFTNPAKRQENGGWVDDKSLRLFRYVQEAKPSFAAYFLAVHKLPYDNYHTAGLGRADLVLRYETLAADFAAALSGLGLTPVRDLPVVNPTAGKAPYLSYYDTPEVRRRAARVFGPYLRKWDYPLPADWDVARHGPWDQLKYDALHRLRGGLLWGTSPRARKVRDLARRLHLRRLGG